ncbi:GPW/gp25 family protein [Erwinia oleae]|uniref:GPW/gp25 family protein n=1 Tax=Erwinia oleae TaxID=796334 RepID=UPI0005578CDC|nr:GPW/gp25 family protein [Erwinia oleae]
MADDILIETYGRSWAFPPDFSATHGVIMAEGEEAVRQSLMVLFLTEPGERVMREDYGSGMNDFMFENITDDLMARIRSRIEESVLRYEPRADITAIALAPAPDDYSRLKVQITWRLLGSDITQKVESLMPIYSGQSLRLR